MLIAIICDSNDVITDYKISISHGDGENFIRKDNFHHFLY